jgi:6,7-dimethyl-8-ribityllumazine synthase
LKGKNSNIVSLNKNVGRDKKIGLVKSVWTIEITDRFYEGCYNTLLKYGVKKNNITTKEVPGSFELIHGAKVIVKENVDVVILIGCIIKGETPHFEFISQAVADGVKDLNIKYDIPFIFCVSTDLNMSQSLERSGGKFGNKGADSALAALQLIK